MPHTNHLFPVNEYYHDHVVDGITIINAGGWWTALLLFEDPKSKVRSLKLYRWRKRDGEWKNAGSNITLKNDKVINKLQEALTTLSRRLDHNYDPHEQPISKGNNYVPPELSEFLD